MGLVIDIRDIMAQRADSKLTGKDRSNPGQSNSPEQTSIASGSLPIVNKDLTRATDAPLLSSVAAKIDNMLNTPVTRLVLKVVEPQTAEAFFSDPSRRNPEAA